MEKLRCELCNGTSFTRTDDGMFKCDFCGCKYTPEQAKVIINGVVETTMGKTELTRLVNNVKAQIKLGNNPGETIARIIQEFPTSYYGYWFNTIQLFTDLYRSHWLTNENIKIIRDNYFKLLKTLDIDSEYTIQDAKSLWEVNFNNIYAKLLSGEMLWNPGTINNDLLTSHELIRKAYNLGLNNAKTLNEISLFVSVEHGKAVFFQNNNKYTRTGFGRFLFAFGRYVEYITSSGQIVKTTIGFSIENVDDNLINIIEMAEKNTMLFIKTNKICFCGAILNQKKWGTLYICPKCQARYEVNVTNK